MNDSYSLQGLKRKVLNGEQIDKAEALFLAVQPLEELCVAADEIREKFCGDTFDICSVINCKCGKCPEDCRYCAQSVHNHANVNGHALIDTEEMLKQARHNKELGALRCELVAGGRRMSDSEIYKVCESIRAIKREVDIEICVSFGLLEKRHFEMLKEAGVSRAHCNLEASEQFFKTICTTHTYQDKISTIKAAKETGLSICSCGIFGLGETMEDRIELALMERSLGVKSLPLNMLKPIPGTPYENAEPVSNEEMQRIVAIFRFILPDAAIRMAAGRDRLNDKGKACFKSGSNAAITGDFLTVSGNKINQDMEMIRKLGYEIGYLKG
ncbi:MAG: biotin synthase BioB [Coprococcus sp.]